MCDGFCSLTRVRWKFLIRNYGKRDYDFGNTVSVHVQLPERSTVASLLNAQFSKSCEKHLWHFCSIQSLSISMNHEQSHKFAFFWRSPANLLPQLFLVWFEGPTAIIAFIRRCVFFNTSVPHCTNLSQTCSCSQHHLTNFDLAAVRVCSNRSIVNDWQWLKENKQQRVVYCTCLVKEVEQRLSSYDSRHAWVVCNSGWSE